MPSKDLRTRRINLSMTEAEATRIQAAAELRGMTVSGYVRSVVVRTLKSGQMEAES